MSGVLEAEIQVLWIDLICSVSPFLLQAKHNGSNHEGPGVGVGGGGITTHEGLHKGYSLGSAVCLQGGWHHPHSTDG